MRVLQHQTDGYLIIIQPKKVEVAEIQESLLSKDEYKQFRAISKANTESTEKAAEIASAEAAMLERTNKNSEAVLVEK